MLVKISQEVCTCGSMLLYYILCIFRVFSEFQGFRSDTKKSLSMNIFRTYEKVKPGIIVIYYVDDCSIMGKPVHVGEMKMKLLKKFGIVEYGQ